MVCWVSRLLRPLKRPVSGSKVTRRNCTHRRVSQHKKTPVALAVLLAAGFHLVLDGRGRTAVHRGRRGPVLQQGHRVGGEAQRWSLSLKHQLVDGVAPVSPHLSGGRGHWKHLDRGGEAADVEERTSGKRKGQRSKSDDLGCRTLTSQFTDLPLASDTA